MRQVAEEDKRAEIAVGQTPSDPAPPASNSGDVQPLSPDKFRRALLEIDSLGLTWTSDLPPDLVAKSKDKSSNFSAEKLEQIEDRYPNLPNELGYVIWYALTGTKPLTDLVGTEADLQAKAEVVKELLVTPEFRDEFFFTQMVKVPSFDNVDWEVIVKTSERGVQHFPGNAYALMTLLMEGNSHYGDKREPVTFAINEVRLERLLAALIDMRTALQRARKFGNQLRNGEDVGTDAAI